MAKLTPAFVLAMLVLLSGCASVGTREPVQFGTASRPAGSESFPNWTEPPQKAMETMSRGEAEVQSVKGTASGTSGAEEVELFLEATKGKVKTKRVPPDLDGINNSPRKELAAYRLQQLFLDPEDYVVPATTLRCIPLDTWRKNHDPRGKPNIEGTNCVLIVAALWLKDVRLPKADLLDRDRFLAEPNYAYYMSNVNVFTHLVEHQDGRRGNFLLSDDDRRHVFAIDNGVSFGQPWPFYNWFVPNWNVLRVPAVRKDTIERLRALSREDLDVLLVVEQLEVDSDGILQLVPPGPPHDPGKGATRKGGTLQFGLTEDEIDDVYERIQDLIEDVDEGDLPVF